jgi:integrase
MARSKQAKRHINKLTATFAATTREPGRHCDGGGLFLVVRPGGSRSWVFIFKRGGKPREMGLGAFDAKGLMGLTVAEARDKAAEARLTLRNGTDPLEAKRATVQPVQDAKTPTFGQVAKTWLATYSKEFKNPKTTKNIERAFEIHAASLLSMNVDAITVQDVLAVLNPIWHLKRKTARELRGRIEQVLDAATVLGKRSGANPALWRGNLVAMFGKNKKKPRHHPAAPYADVSGIVKKLQAKHSAADTVVNLAAEYIILTAVRTSESRFMRVAEINFQARQWSIPAARMKSPKDHEVPLCGRAIAILNAVIPKDAKPDDFVFTGLRLGEPLGMNAVLHAIKAVYPGITTHGFRSSFRDWAGDMTSFPREVAEMALSHAVGDEVEQAYRRGTALEKRRQLMDAWGAYVEGAYVQESSNVVALGHKKKGMVGQDHATN